MKHAVLIINPSSGKSTIQDSVPIIKEQLLKKYQQVDVRWTEKKGDAEVFAVQAKGDIFCAGGDGTIREVVNGMMKTKQKGALGIIPTGTVNDLARSLNIPLKWKEAVKVLMASHIAHIDVGQVNNEYFISLIAIGGIPEAIHDVSIEAKTKWGALSYLMNGAKYAMKQKPFLLSLHLDGNQQTISTSLVVISLRNSVAGMKHFFKEAEPDDGQFRIMLFPTFRFFGAGWFVFKIIIGKIAQSKSITIIPFKNGKITAPDLSLPINVDGDKNDALPLEINIIPKVLPVFCPDK